MEEIKQLLQTLLRNQNDLYSRLDKLEALVKEETRNAKDEIKDQQQNSTQKIIEEMERQTKAMAEALMEALRNNLAAQREMMSAKIDEIASILGSGKAQELLSKLSETSEKMERALEAAHKAEDDDAIMVLQDRITDVSRQMAEIRKTMEEEHQSLADGILDIGNTIIKGINGVGRAIEGVGRAVEGVGRAVEGNGEAIVTVAKNTRIIYQKLERLEKTLDVNAGLAEKIYDKVNHELGSVYEMVRSSHDRRMYGY